jgi:urease accessory protein
VIQYRTWQKRFWLILAGIVSGALPTHAHLVNTGLGPFYDGLVHVLVSPADLLPLIAFALFAGLRGPLFGRILLCSLPLAWLMGFGAASAGIFRFGSPVMMTLITIALGILLAADRPLPPAALAALAVFIGLLHGVANGTELARTPSNAVVATGAAIAMIIVVSLLAGQATSIRAPWARVATRVVGSWIAAIGVLTLGWSLRGTT